LATRIETSQARGGRGSMGSRGVSTDSPARLAYPLGRKDAGCSPTKPFVFRAVYRKKFSVSNFWATGSVNSFATVDTSKAGMITITVKQSDPPFNEVVFGMCATTRILSICYQTDVSDELAGMDNQLNKFVDLLYPGRKAGNGGTGAGSAGAGGAGSSGGAVGG